MAYYRGLNINIRCIEINDTLRFEDDGIGLNINIRCIEIKETLTEHTRRCR